MNRFLGTNIMMKFHWSSYRDSACIDEPVINRRVCRSRADEPIDFTQILKADLGLPGRLMVDRQHDVERASNQRNDSQDWVWWRFHNDREIEFGCENAVN